MNAKLLILPLAAALPFAALAAPPAPTTTVMVHCVYGQWPTRDQVARNLEIPRVTVGELRGLHEPASAAVATDANVRQLQHDIRREGRRYCEQGASHVQVDFHPTRDRGVAMVTVAGESP